MTFRIETADGVLPFAVLAQQQQAQRPSTPPMQQQIRRPEFRSPLIGLFRDIKGIASSASAAREFELVLSWLCPKRMPVLSAAAGAWWNDEGVISPLLKLYARRDPGRKADETHVR